MGGEPRCRRRAPCSPWLRLRRPVLIRVGPRASGRPPDAVLGGVPIAGQAEPTKGRHAHCHRMTVSRGSLPKSAPKSKGRHRRRFSAPSPRAMRSTNAGLPCRSVGISQPACDVPASACTQLPGLGSDGVWPQRGGGGLGFCCVATTQSPSLTKWFIRQLAPWFGTDTGDRSSCCPGRRNPGRRLASEGGRREKSKNTRPLGARVKRIP